MHFSQQFTLQRDAEHSQHQHNHTVPHCNEQLRTAWCAHRHRHIHVAVAMATVQIGTDTDCAVDHAEQGWKNGMDGGKIKNFNLKIFKK